jgi:hypothetical protein
MAGGVSMVGEFDVRVADCLIAFKFLTAGKATMAASIVKKHRFRGDMAALLTPR